MKLQILLGEFFILCIILTFSYSIAHSLLADSASATGNTFTAASISPSISPSVTPSITPTTSPSISPSVTPAPDLAGIANHVVISEVQIASSGSTDGDFIELYNPTSNPISLDPFRLEKRASTGTQSDIVVFTSNDSIPAHGFYLWANSSNNFAAQLSADKSTTDTLASNNSIALILESNSSIIDAIAWGAGLTNPFIEGSANVNPPAGGSIERKALTTSTQGTMEGGSDVSKGNGFDAGDNSTDFILRTVSQPQNSASGTEIP